MNTAEFLSTVVTTDSGFFELCVRNGTWQQHWYEWPNQLTDIVAHSQQAVGDVYFSSYLFQSKDSHKANVLPSRTIQQDLDNADPSSIPLQPSILIETSPNRHQGFWILQQSTDLSEHEYLSKKLAYSIPLCDRSGWPLGHKVRVPNTSNYKYLPLTHQVTISNVTNKIYTTEELQVLPDISVAQVELDYSFIQDPPATYGIGPQTLVDSIKDQLSAKVYSEYITDVPSSDRSIALWGLLTQCFKAGLSREQVYWVALNSPNNKFATLKHNQARELAKDVLRAEQSVKSIAANIRDLINDIRKQTKNLISDRHHAIYQLILGAMRSEGEFVRTQDSRSYYLQKDIGRPIDIEEYSPYLRAMLDVKYGLNRTEVAHNWVIGSLQSYCTTLPETANVRTLSHYDRVSHQLLIHGGRKAVYVITPTSLTVESNGAYGALFPWGQIVEPFQPNLDPNNNLDWGNILFGDIPNVTNLTPDQARVVLKVYLLFCLLRTAANSRPILALFGAPGSGKSTLARKIYAFIYGRNVDISGVTTQANFDMATTSLPFFTLDNLDTWEKWIPDRLAQSTGNTDVPVRKLYSNQSIVMLKRQAMICVTAHDPKFGRADVADRLLIINLQRLNMSGNKFKDEAQILQQVLPNRNKLWGAVINDLQKIMATPIPPTTELQLRIQDFAKWGEWIALGTGDQDLFRQAVLALRDTQHSFNLDEDHILITALQKWIATHNCDPPPKTQEQLYQEVMLFVPTDERMTFMVLYKNSSALIKRIATLEETLSTLMTYSFHVDKQGTKLYKFKCT